MRRGSIADPGVKGGARLVPVLLAALPLAASSDGLPEPARPPATPALREIRLPPPPAAPWEPLSFRRIGRATRYTGLRGGDAPGVRAVSECSASALVLGLDEIVPGVDLARTPRLAWRWRVERGLAIGDEKTKAGDDFAARVYALFAYEPERASAPRRWLQRLGRLLYGDEIPGTALVFVWTRSTPPGDTWENPYSDESRMVALATGDGGGWREETVDLVALYRALFGHAPPALEGLALMSDSDDTCQSAVAELADFRLLAAPGNGGKRPPAPDIEGGRGDRPAGRSPGDRP